MCQGWHSSDCYNITGNHICCRLKTDSGSSDNCGSPCSEAQPHRPGECCACTELPPTRLPEFIEIKPGSCEYDRIQQDWVSALWRLWQIYYSL